MSLDLNFKNTEQVITLLKAGKIGVMPTDTIYGIVGSALNPQTVEEIYKLRKRIAAKPFIILISNLEDLQKFNINLSKAQKSFLTNIWPNSVSVVLPCPDDKFLYLHRGKNSLAFRVPNNKILLGILKKTGPLVAPSANLEKEKPAEDIAEAKKYFGDKVFFYIDKGRLKSTASTIIQLYEDGRIIVLRQGSFKI